MPHDNFEYAAKIMDYGLNNFKCKTTLLTLELTLKLCLRFCSDIATISELFININLLTQLQ